MLVLLAFDHIVAYRLLGWAGTRHLIPRAHSVGGATSWFNLPGFNFQPSEFIKIVIVIYLAKITKEHNENMLIRTFQGEVDYLLDVLKIIIPPIVLICCIFKRIKKRMVFIIRYSCLINFRISYIFIYIPT